MAPDDDLTTTEELVNALKDVFHWCIAFLSLLMPASLGAVVGAWRQNRRKMTRRKLVQTALVSAVVGCGVSPLVAYALKIPDSAATSLAFFMGYLGLEGLDIIQHVIRDKAGIDDLSTPEDISKGEK